MTVLYFFFVLLTSVASNPVLKYSFCPPWNLRCEATLFASDSPFEFGNISSGVYFVDPKLRIRPLSISCTFHEPLRWVLSAKQDVKANFISSNVTINASHPLYHYHINFNEASPGLIRCEGYENEDHAAEIYIALLDSKEVYDHQDASLHLFSPSSGKRGGQLIVPCNLIAFDSNFNAAITNWLKKVPQNVMVPLSVSQECLSCFPHSQPDAANCTTNCPYGISPALWTDAGRPAGVNKSSDEWRDCVGDKDCAFKVAKHAWKLLQRDCSDDGQITCSDYFSAMSAYPNRCENGKNVQSNFREIEACMVKKFGKELDSTEADYDPRIGFRLKSADLDAVYLCRSSHGTPETAYLMPYNPNKRITTSLQANNRTSTSALAGISCTVPQQRMEQDVLLQMLPCSTLFECETQLQVIEGNVIFRTSNEIVNSSEPISKLSSSSYGRVIKDPVRSGIVTCAASYGYDIGYIWDMKFFFTGLDSKIYFTTDHLPPEALISLKKLQTNFNQATNQLDIQVECTVATFIIFPNLEFVTEYSNGTISKIDGDPVVPKPEENPSAERYHAASQRLIESVGASVVAIRCRANYRNSMKRVEAILSIASVEKQTDEDEEPLASQSNGTSSQVYIVVIPTLGCVILVAGSIALGVYTVCKDKKSKKWRQLTVEEADEFLKGNAAIPSIGTKNELNIDAIGFPESYQIIPVDLKLNMQEVLGEGQFGRCVKGHFNGKEVAVKTLKGASDVDTFKAFLREVKIMAYLGPHENIVQFLGAVVNQLRERECLAVVELCPCGDLLKYLRKNDPESSSKGNRYSNIFQPEENSKKVTLEMQDLVYFCEQIAAGMEFLGSKKVIHGDLAARNVLVFANNVLKITDFGLSRKLYTASNYQKKNVTPLPWAWMAIESLKYMEFSPMTDMWSYGVTVWEIFTFGQVPFAGLSYSSEFIAEVEGGRRLQCPKLAPEEIYQFMMLTWDGNPSARPLFEDAKLFFRQHSATTEQVSLLQALP